MKKIYAINLSVLALIFLTAGVMASPNTDNQTIRKHISSRIEILNSYYSGEESFDQTREALVAIEKSTLLRNDTTLMQAYSATDLDQIVKYKVKVSSCRRTSYGIIKGKVSISYVLDGYEGKWETEQAYYFTAEDNGKKVKLSQLKKI